MIGGSVHPLVLSLTWPGKLEGRPIDRGMDTQEAIQQLEEFRRRVCDSSCQRRRGDGSDRCSSQQHWSSTGGRRDDTLPFHHELCAQVEDSHYGHPKFLVPAARYDNLITIARLCGNPVLYRPALPTPEEEWEHGHPT
jgi:hypothetical protein